MAKYAIVELFVSIGSVAKFDVTYRVLSDFDMPFHGKEPTVDGIFPAS